MKINYFSKRNFMMTIASLLVVAMGYMALKTYKKPEPPKTLTYEQQVQKLQNQSGSDSMKSIEKDLNDTDLTGVDQELNDIDTTLNSPDK